MTPQIQQIATPPMTPPAAPQAEVSIPTYAPPAPPAAPLPNPSMILPEAPSMAMVNPAPAVMQAVPASIPDQTLTNQTLDQPLSRNELEAPQYVKEIMIKMEELTPTLAPSWTQEFSFPYADSLKGEHGQMMEQLRQMQLRISALDARIRAIEGLKHVLLTGEQNALMSASQEVLSRLGWTVSPSRSNPGEFWLSRGDQIDAIARIVRSPQVASRSDIAQLAESVIAFWDEYEIEPKGILIGQTWFSKSPRERTEPDFTPALQEFAGKKSLCLMSSMQLLAMYKDLELGNMPVEEMRKRMLETNGRLLGFTLDDNIQQA